MPRIDYDDNQYIVKATVLDKGEGRLDVKQEYFRLENGELKAFEDGSFAFTNRYMDQASVSIPVKKLLRDWKADDVYTFELYGIQDPAAGEAPASDEAAAADGTPAIDGRTWRVTLARSDAQSETQSEIKLDYDQDSLGAWYYALREQIPGNALGYDKTTNAVIMVYKKPGSKATTQLTYGDYATKLLDTRNGLAEKDIYWKLDGLVYDDTVHTIKVVVAYDPQVKHLRATAYADGSEAALAQAVTFKNEFVAEPTSAQVTVSKEIKNRPWLRPEDESYTIKITPRDGAPAPSASRLEITRSYLDKQNPIQSDSFSIPFVWKDLENEDGTHAEYREFYYDLSEVIPENTELELGGNRIVYDKTSRAVKVTLINNQDGTMHTEVQYLDAQGKPAEGAVPFVNTYEKEPKLAQFPVTIAKKVNGVNATQREYSFSLYREAEDGEGHKTIVKVGDSLVWKAEDVGKDAGGKEDSTLRRANAVVRLADCDIDTSNITVGSPQTFHFFLREDIPNEAVGYDAEGKEIVYGNATEEQQADETILWTLEGTTYQSSRIPVAVKVSLSEVDYLMKADVTYNTKDQAATFLNAYASSGSTQMHVNKALTGREFRENETFSFELLPQDGAPLAVMDEGQRVSKDSLTLEVGKEGNAFDEMVFDLNDVWDAGKSQNADEGMYAEKNFSYLVREVVPGEATAQIGEETVRYADATEQQKTTSTWKYKGVTYDSRARIVTVNVKDDGKGHLNVTYTGDSQREMTFNNSYEATPVTVALPVGKAILGEDDQPVAAWKIDGEGDWQDMRFSFTIAPKAAEYPCPKGENATITVDYANQSGTYDPMVFNAIGVYEYTISEVLPQGKVYSHERNLLYDKAAHTVKVTIRDDLEGKLFVDGIDFDGEAIFDANEDHRNAGHHEPVHTGCRDQWREDLAGRQREARGQRKADRPDAGACEREGPGGGPGDRWQR